MERSSLWKILLAVGIGLALIAFVLGMNIKIIDN
jgi:hypothetical protein